MEENAYPQWPGWRTVKVLGRGSYGAVYEIERELFGKKEKAALKFIRIPQTESEVEELYADGYDNKSVRAAYESYLQSIVEEYSLMRKLNGNSNVVNCDDVQYLAHADGIGWDIFIKMELLTPLAKAIPDPIPEETTIRLAKDLAHALVLCRRHKIVHRDIKPQNIFLSENGDFKLGDFGVAKTMEKTMGGTKTGTYRYMAPEVYYSKPYGHTADIYSLGLVLYWMLNKRRMPFVPLPPVAPNASMDEQARSRRLSGETLPLPADGSPELQRIVLKACAWAPKDRYHSAEEMLKDLDQLGAEALPASAGKQVSAEEYRRFVPAPEERKPSPGLIAEHMNDPGLAFGRETARGSEFCRTADADSTLGADQNGLRTALQPEPTETPVFAAGIPTSDEEGTVGVCQDQPRTEMPAAAAFSDGLSGPDGDGTVGVYRNQPRTGASAAAFSNREPSFDQNGTVGAFGGHPDRKAGQPEAVRESGPGKAVPKAEKPEAPKQPAHRPAEDPKPAPVKPASAKPAEQPPSGAPASAPPAASLFKKLIPILAAVLAVAVLLIWSPWSKGDEPEKVSPSPGQTESAGRPSADTEAKPDPLEPVSLHPGNSIAVGAYHTVGLRPDGTVAATGLNVDGQCDVEDWRNIVAVSASKDFTIGLRGDGTVAATGDNTYGQCNVSDWEDITAISAGSYHTVGVRSDGTVKAVGSNDYGQCNVSGWRDIVAVSAGWDYTVGLRSDGTVVAVGYSGSSQCEVGDWKDIVAVSAGSWYTLGLRADGTVALAGNGGQEEAESIIRSWKQVTAINSAMYYVGCVHSDGSVEVTGSANIVMSDRDWSSIVALGIGVDHVVGLRSDGTVVAMGENEDGQCEVSDWKLKVG